MGADRTLIFIAISRIQLPAGRKLYRDLVFFEVVLSNCIRSRQYGSHSRINR